MINVITDPGDYEQKTYGEIHGGSWGRVGVQTGTRGGFEDEGVGYFANLGYDRADGYRDNSGFDLWNAQGGIRKDFANASFLRSRLLKKLELPEHMSSNAMLQALNLLYNLEELTGIVSDLEKNDG